LISSYALPADLFMLIYSFKKRVMPQGGQGMEADENIYISKKQKDLYNKLCEKQYVQMNLF